MSTSLYLEYRALVFELVNASSAYDEEDRETKDRYSVARGALDNFMRALIEHPARAAPASERTLDPDTHVRLRWTGSRCIRCGAPEGGER